jgi:hypothetical protein
LGGQVGQRPWTDGSGPVRTTVEHCEVESVAHLTRCGYPAGRTVFKITGAAILSLSHRPSESLPWRGSSLVCPVDSSRSARRTSAGSARVKRAHGCAEARTAVGAPAPCPLLGIVGPGPRRTRVGPALVECNLNRPKWPAVTYFGPMAERASCRAGPSAHVRAAEGGRLGRARTAKEAGIGSGLKGSIFRLLDHLAVARGPRSGMGSRADTQDARS